MTKNTLEETKVTAMIHTITGAEQEIAAIRRLDMRSAATSNYLTMQRIYKIDQALSKLRGQLMDLTGWELDHDTTDEARWDQHMQNLIAKDVQADPIGDAAEEQNMEDDGHTPDYPRRYDTETSDDDMEDAHGDERDGGNLADPDEQAYWDGQAEDQARYQQQLDRERQAEGDEADAWVELHNAAAAAHKASESAKDYMP